MAVQVAALVETKYLENAQTTQYTSTDVKTIIDKCTVYNDTAFNGFVTINLVPSGGSVDSTNIVVNMILLPGETYSCPGVVGHILEIGDFVSAAAGAAGIVFRMSGRKVTT